MLAYYSKNCKGGSIVIDVPAFVMSCSLVRPGALLSTRRIPAAPPHSQKTPVSPGAGHGQGPLPRDREDSIGMPFARFQRTLAVLPQGSITRRCAPFRCFRPVFSVRGSRRGSTGALRREKQIGPRWRTSTAAKRRSTLHWCRPYRKNKSLRPCPSPNRRVQHKPDG